MKTSLPPAAVVVAAVTLLMLLLSPSAGTVSAQQNAPARRRSAGLTSSDLIGAASRPNELADAARWYEGADGFAQAEGQQREARATLIVYFRVDWCGYCRALEQQVLASAEFQQFAGKMLKVRINPEAGAAERALAKRFGITGYPSFFIVPNTGAQPIKLSRYKYENGNWVARSPLEFVAACAVAASAQP